MFTLYAENHQPRTEDYLLMERIGKSSRSRPYVKVDDRVRDIIETKDEYGRVISTREVYGPLFTILQESREFIFNGTISDRELMKDLQSRMDLKSREIKESGVQKNLEDLTALNNGARVIMKALSEGTRVMRL